MFWLYSNTQPIQRITINSCSHCLPTGQVIEQKHKNMMVLKDCCHNFLRRWLYFDFLTGETRGDSIILMLTSSQVSHNAPTFRFLWQLVEGKDNPSRHTALNTQVATRYSWFYSCQTGATVSNKNTSFNFS